MNAKELYTKQVNDLCEKNCNITAEDILAKAQALKQGNLLKQMLWHASYWQVLLFWPQPDIWVISSKTLWETKNPRS